MGNGFGTSLPAQPISHRPERPVRRREDRSVQTYAATQFPVSSDEVLSDVLFVRMFFFLHTAKDKAHWTGRVILHKRKSVTKHRKEVSDTEPLPESLQ